MKKERTKQNPNKVSLYRWIHQSFVKTAIIPLVLIEFVFIGIYFYTDSWLNREITSSLKEQVNSELSELSQVEASLIDIQLAGIEKLSGFYASLVSNALSKPAIFEQRDTDRLAYTSDGAFYSVKDKSEGGAAVFYSGFYNVGQAQLNKVAKLLTLQDTMKELKRSVPLISSIYVNTFDSLNVIYPYFDVMKQYTVGADITSFNFYYLADAVNNPSRNAKWTKVYLDPAGQGWMTSSIIPVYYGDTLEGVAGIDVTMNTITNQLLELDVPWDGYGILLSADGTIMALPEQGESDWGLKELTGHHYSEAILADTFKPEEFNIFNMENLGSFPDTISKTSAGFSVIRLGDGYHVVSWNTVNATGWKLLLVVPEENIYLKPNLLAQEMLTVGVVMLIGLAVFYLLFYFILSWRAKRTSYEIASPLIEINEIVRQIGSGRYYQPQPDFRVIEIQRTASNLISMGEHLGFTSATLKNREADLRAIVNSIDDIIIDMKPDGHVVNIWASQKDMLSARCEKNKVTTINDIFEPEIMDDFLTLAKIVTDTGIPQIMEYRMETKQSKRWFQARISVIHDEKQHFVITARDITEKKSMEASLLAAKEEAEKANMAKTEFLCSMSHELKTPLNAVLGFSELLKIDPEVSLNPIQKQYLDEISKAGFNLLGLINNVLSFSEINSGKVTADAIPVLVSAVIKEAVNLMYPACEQSGIEITTSCMSESFYILADKYYFKQTLLQLLSNAVKFNTPNGKILVMCDKVEDNIFIKVIDTGLGISKEELRVIFEPFVHLNNQKTIEGMGIGLALVARYMKLMSGRVECESEPGIGTTFTLIFKMHKR